MVDYFVFVELEKAFDPVYKQMIWRVLRKTGFVGGTEF